MNITDPLIQFAEQQPDKPAIIAGERSISYREFDRLVGQTANHLVNLGVQPGDRVGLCLKDNPQHIICFFAVARMGAIAFAIDWRAAASEKETRAGSFGASLVLVEARAASVAETRTVNLDTDWEQAIAAAEPLTSYPQDPNAPATIHNSSGTTGSPRGVVITHKQVSERTRLYQIHLRMSDPHQYFSVLPLCFSGGSDFYVGHLMTGNTVILYPPLFSAREYVEEVNRCGATFAALVPTALRWLLDLPDQDAPLLPSVTSLISLGAPLFAEEKLAVRSKISPNLYDAYGSSATGTIACLGPSEIEAKAESVGRPVSTVVLEIVDDDDKPLGPGAMGRVRVRGSSTASKYFGDVVSFADNEGFHDDWFYTGELAETDEDGYVHVKGRIKSVIIRGGANIYPEEVEEVLCTHPEVAEAAVVGRPSREFGETVAAFVVADESLDPDSLISHCRDHLTGYKVPQHVIRLDKFPKTTSGKVLKSELTAMLQDEPQDGA